MTQHVTKVHILTGRHVALTFAGFFAIVFAVNIYFVKVALSTHTGVVANEPYRKGLKYNERIAASERQDGLRWNSAITLSADGQRLIVQLHDETGNAVRGLDVSAMIGRAATTREDAALSLSETELGQYEAALNLAGEGGYVASIEAHAAAGGDANVLYRARSRLWLKR